MSFTYLAPTSVEETLALLAQHGPQARLLAGGTDLMVLLRRQKIAPTCLIDVGRVAGLDKLALEDGQIVIGARVVHRQIETSPLFTGALRALPEACATVGSVQIRNVATLAGNLCNASPAADTPPVLLSFGATVRIAGPAGVREVPLEQFFKGYRQTALLPGELLTEICLPAPPPRTGSRFEKLGRRKAMEISIACVAATVTLAPDATVAAVRIGLGSVAPVSLRARQAEAALLGQRLTPERLAAAGRAAAAECAPIDDLRATGEYRRMVVETLVARAVATAAERALQSGEGD